MRLIKRKIYAKPLKRDAWLYIGLPDDYKDGNQDYPVLYMHDGHNVFLKEDSFIGQTWGMLELYKDNSHLDDIIVVALNASQEEGGRCYEYSPYKFEFENDDFENCGGGGDLYLNYLVNQVKPMIDNEFRTKRDQMNTWMMGSSLGGFISLYAGIKYPHVFGRIASLSGSFFVAEKQLIKDIESFDFSNIDYIYLDTGDEEVAGGSPKDYLDSNQKIYQVIKDKYKDIKIDFETIHDGKHSEVDWAQRLESILKKIIY